MNVLRFFILALFSLTANAAEIQVAVASNFILPMRDISAAFQRQSIHSVTLSSGSSGKLYAQILQGAPFDVFLSADREKPAALEHSGHGVSGSRFTYTQGTLALIASNASNSDPKTQLTEGKFSKLGIANPRLAPYGAAALEVLRSLGLRESVSNKLVIGENVGQVFHYVTSGNVQLALIATAQLHNLQEQTSYWRVPTTLHSPIYQDAVLLKQGTDNPAARELLDFLQSEQALSIMGDYGYQPAGQQ